MTCYDATAIAANKSFFQSLPQAKLDHRGPEQSGNFIAHDVYNGNNNNSPNVKQLFHENNAATNNNIQKQQHTTNAGPLPLYQLELLTKGAPE